MGRQVKMVEIACKYLSFHKEGIINNFFTFLRKQYYEEDDFGNNSIMFRCWSNWICAAGKCRILLSQSGILQKIRISGGWIQAQARRAGRNYRRQAVRNVF
jgi:hypothetical protein